MSSPPVGRRKRYYPPESDSRGATMPAYSLGADERVSSAGNSLAIENSKQHPKAAASASGIGGPAEIIVRTTSAAAALRCGCRSTTTPGKDPIDVDRTKEGYAQACSGAAGMT